MLFIAYIFSIYNKSLKPLPSITSLLFYPTGLVSEQAS